MAFDRNRKGVIGEARVTNKLQGKEMNERFPDSSSSHLHFKLIDRESSEEMEWRVWNGDEG